MNGTEDFVNWLNDLHWGPFEFLRPPKDVDIGPRLFVQVCLLAVPLMVTIILVMGALIVFYFTFPNFHRLPTLPQYGEATRLFLKELGWTVIASIIWFPLAWWPCVFYWNQRAARLRQPPLPAPPPQEGVWPPAPKRI